MTHQSPLSFDIPPCRKCTTFYYGLCVVCGANGKKRCREENEEFDSSSGRTLKRRCDNLRFIVPGMSCNDPRLFKEIFDASAKSLKASKKLRLILDLDETCIYAFKLKTKIGGKVSKSIEMEVDPKHGLVLHNSGPILISEEKEVFNSLPRSFDDYTLDFFDLPSDKNILRVFVRPYLREFLESVQDFFEIFIYSHGTQDYVQKIVENLKIHQYVQGVFGRSSRNTIRNPKSLLKILTQRNIGVIIDDKKEVWKEIDQPNVLKIPAYYGEKIDNAFKVLELQLTNLHREFYEKDNNDVREIIKKIPSLDDTDILTDDIFDDNSQDGLSLFDD